MPLIHCTIASEVPWLLRDTAGRCALTVSVPASAYSADLQCVQILLCTCDLMQALPVPHLLAPRLECVSDMMEGTAAWDMTWLTSLARLPHLVQLQLALADHPPPDQEWLNLPAFPALTSLDLLIHVDEAGVRLGALPSLQCCTLVAMSDLDMSTAGSLPRLRDLHVRCTGLEEFTVDFVQMPALQLATLDIDEGYMPAAATIVAATQPAGLDIFFTPGDEFLDWGGWEVELLRALPPSVRYLSIYGLWDESLAAELEQKSHLVVLGLGFANSAGPGAAGFCPLPPPGAPLWSNLRALRLLGTVGRPLPLVSAVACSASALCRHTISGAVLAYELAACGPELRTLGSPAAFVLQHHCRVCWLRARAETAVFMRAAQEELRGATQLQLLQVDREHLSSEELEVIPSLPALQQLYLPSMPMERSRAALSLLQRRMPHAQLFGGRAFFGIGNFLQRAEQFALQ